MIFQWLTFVLRNADANASITVPVNLSLPFSSLALPLLVSRLKKRWIQLGCGLLAFVCMASAVAEQKGFDFAIKTIRLEGNTVLAEKELRPLLFRYIGPGRKFSDLRQLVTEIEKRYHDAGYPTVKVVLPPQNLTKGEVRLDVVEFKLGYVSVGDGEYFDADNLKRSLPALRSGVVPNNSELAQALERANSHPAKRVQVIFKPGQDAQQIDAELVVEERQPFDLRLSYNNEGTDFSGENQLSVEARYLNLFGFDHEVGVQIIGSPLDEQSFVAGLVTYSVPLYSVGGELRLFGYESKVDDVQFRSNFSVAGVGSSYGLQYAQTLNGGAGLKHSLSAGVTYKSYGSTVMFNGVVANEVPEFNSLPLSVGYDLLYRPPNATWYGQFGISANGNLLTGDDNDQEFDVARSGSSANFLTLGARLAFATEIEADWRLRLAAGGQYTDMPLVPTEQYGIGGMGSFRGIASRSLTDDRGYAATFELYSPDFGRSLFGEQFELRALVFSDFAGLRRVDALPGEVAKRDLTSYGLGMRFRLKDQLGLTLDYAWLDTETSALVADTGRLHVGFNWLWHP